MSAKTEDWNAPAEEAATGRPPDGPHGRLIVERSSAAATAELRRAVLRPHLTVEEMAVAGDQDADAAYLAVRADSGDRPMLGCVRVQPAPCPWPDAVAEGDPEYDAAWQLRAMATDPAGRRTGIGRLLVEAAVRFVGERGGGLIWCNARVSAEGFYSRLGFHRVTDRFKLPQVGEDHVGMVLEL